MNIILEQEKKNNVLGKVDDGSRKSNLFSDESEFVDSLYISTLAATKEDIYIKAMDKFPSKSTCELLYVFGNSASGQLLF